MTLRTDKRKLLWPAALAALALLGGPGTGSSTQVVSVIDISDESCARAFVQSGHRAIWFEDDILIALTDSKADIADLSACSRVSIEVEPDLSQSPLYLFSGARLPKTLPANATAAYSDRDIALVRATDEAVYAFAAEGLAPFRLLAYPLPFPPPDIEPHGSKLGKTVSDSLIDYMLSHVTQEECTRLVAGLSGAEAVEIDGEMQTITDRIWSSQNNELAVEFILQEFDSAGVPAVRDTFRISSTLTQNIVATLPGGVHPDSVVIVCGHYDAVPGSPGADDNASGTMTAIVAAQVFSKFSFDYTIKFICFNAEEIGLVGSQSYSARALDAGEKIAAVINLDMIGYSYASSPNVNVFANSRSEWLGYEFAYAADNYTSLLPRVVLNSSVWSRSDHYPFATRGYSAIFGHEGTANPHYHSRYDNIGNMNMEYCTEVVRASLATVAMVAGPIYGPLPPLVLEATDTGSGESVLLEWSESLTGKVTGYRIFYRPVDGGLGGGKTAYQAGSMSRIDSSGWWKRADISEAGGALTILGRDTSVEVHGLDEGLTYRFSVAAIDSTGLAGVPSVPATSESYVVPRTPRNVVVEDLHTDQALAVSWKPNSELDVVGYRVYYGMGPDVFPDSSMVEVQDTVAVLDSLANSAQYFVTVTAIDADSNESESAEEATGVPTGNPTAPLGLSVRSIRGGLAVSWKRSIEDDVIGYYVYRSDVPGDSFAFAASTPSREDTSYIEMGLTEPSRVYFEVAAFDEDGNTGDRTSPQSGVPVTLNREVLVIDDTEQPMITGYDDAAEDAVIDSLFELNGYAVSQWDVWRDGIPEEEDLYGHAAILWRVDHNRGIAYSLADGASGILGSYVRAGGHLWVVGWAPARSVSQDDQSYPIRFMGNGFAQAALGISEANAPLSSPLDFMGAVGGIVEGFSSVWIDSLGRWSVYWEDYGGIPDGEILTLLPGAQAILTYRSMNGYGGFEGEPCAAINRYGDGTAVYFGFPLFFMQTDDLMRVTAHIMEVFGLLSNEIPDSRRARSKNETSAGSRAAIGPVVRCDVFPSPFHGELRIAFESTLSQEVQVEVFDVSGRLVRRMQAAHDSGAQVVVWDGTDQRGEPTGAGIYFVRVKSADLDVTRKVVHLR